MGRDSTDGSPGSNRTDAGFCWACAQPGPPPEDVKPSGSASFGRKARADSSHRVPRSTGWDGASHRPSFGQAIHFVEQLPLPDARATALCCQGKEGFGCCRQSDPSLA